MKSLYVLFLIIVSFSLNAQTNSSVLLTSKVVSLNGDTLILGDTLAEYSGSLILVDFWASWCGPCLNEMPYSKKVQVEFSGEPLIFLYLSTDRGNGEWKRGLSRININGLHFRLLPEFKPQIQQAYAIRGIPYYQLLGRKQELLINGAAWPSYDKLYKQIRKRL